MATPAERMRAHRQRARRGLRRLTVDVRGDDLSVIVEQGYEDAASSDQDCRSQAVSRFISDTVAVSNAPAETVLQPFGCGVTPARLALRRNGSGRDAVTDGSKSLPQRGDAGRISAGRCVYPTS